MRMDILTLFPDMFTGPFDESIIKKAQKKSLIEINIHNLRKWTLDKHKTVDDRPFGGGVGMIIKVDVVDRAVKTLKNRGKIKSMNTKVILLDAGGKKFTQNKALQLSKLEHLILIAGHYEGADYRIHKYLADEVISIGDYVLTGGEIPTMVLVDAIVRLIPGVIVKKDAIKFESFARPRKLLEYPQYSRPEKYLKWKVPAVLLSGNHKEIEKWKQKQSLIKTKKVRPDLINK
jgi:tRNA (guanine37-N1)-methyltransferase